jgi:hypothetical protein
MDRQTSTRTIIEDHVMPLSAHDIYEAVADDRAQGRSGARGAAIGSLSLVGIGVQTHQQRQPKPITDGQKEFIFNLADDDGYLNEDDESANLFQGRKVTELTSGEASKLIDHLKRKRDEDRR